MKFAAMTLVALALLISGCSDKKQAAPEPREQTCASDDDCQDGWVCLDEECADPSSTAIYTDPSNAVTPDKVKRQIEKIGADREKRNDRLLEGL